MDAGFVTQESVLVSYAKYTNTLAACVIPSRRYCVHYILKTSEWRKVYRLGNKMMTKILFSE